MQQGQKSRISYHKSFGGRDQRSKLRFQAHKALLGSQPRVGQPGKPAGCEQEIRQRPMEEMAGNSTLVITGQRRTLYILMAVAELEGWVLQ